MEQHTDKHIPKLKDISETLLVPLFFKAKETIENGVIKDHAAVNIVKHLHYDFERMKTDWKTQLLIAVRTEILDEVANDYVRSTQNPVIVNLGAGLDTRHIRFDDAKWYQLDLDEPMNLRTLFFGSKDINIRKSILDFSWVTDVKEKENVLFIIEGVLMYLDETQVKSIFRIIGLNFKNCFIVYDTIPESFVKKREHQSINLKQAPFKWGNNHFSKIEKWGYGFKGKRHYHYLSKHRRRWKGLSLLSLFNIHNGFKVNLMKIN